MIKITTNRRVMIHTAVIIMNLTKKWFGINIAQIKCRDSLYMTTLLENILYSVISAKILYWNQTGNDILIGSIHSQLTTQIIQVKSILLFCA